MQLEFESERLGFRRKRRASVESGTGPCSLTPAITSNLAIRQPSKLVNLSMQSIDFALQ